MERNLDTVRKILIATEELDSGNTLGLDDFSSDDAYEISYHVKLLIESGLVDATIPPRMGETAPKDFFLRSLTWNGHEFLDAVRDEKIWNKTKNIFIEKGSTMTFELLKAVAISYTKSALGLDNT